MRRLLRADDPALPELHLQVDSTWLEHITNFSSLSGALLGGGLILSAGAIAVGALAWAASRAGRFDLRSRFARRLGAALVGAVALGSLAGIVGWGMGFDLEL